MWCRSTKPGRRRSEPDGRSRGPVRPAQGADRHDARAPRVRPDPRRRFRDRLIRPVHRRPGGVTPCDPYARPSPLAEGGARAADRLPCVAAVALRRAGAHRHRLRRGRRRRRCRGVRVGVRRARAATARSRSRTTSRTSSRSTASTSTSGRTASGRTGTGTTGCARPTTSSTRSSRACGTRTGCGDADDPDQDKRVDDSDLSGDQGVTDPSRPPVPARGREARVPRQRARGGQGVLRLPRGHDGLLGDRRRGPGAPRQVQPRCGPRATACTPARTAAGTATSPSCRRTTTRAGPPRELRERHAARRSPRTASGGATGRRPPTSGSSRAASTGGEGASYDFAVMHVTPEKGSDGKSLEETVGSALPVDFDAPAVPKVDEHDGDGLSGRAAVRRPDACTSAPTSRAGCRWTQADPTMYRIGCTMTGGSSGGGWVADGLGRQAGAGLQHLDRPGRRPAGWPVRAWARWPRACTTR